MRTKAKEMAGRMKKAKFDFEDYLESMQADEEDGWHLAKYHEACFPGLGGMGHGARLKGLGDRDR